MGPATVVLLARFTAQAASHGLPVCFVFVTAQSTHLRLPRQATTRQRATGARRAFIHAIQSPDPAVPLALVLHVMQGFSHRADVAVLGRIVNECRLVQPLM